MRVKILVFALACMAMAAQAVPINFGDVPANTVEPSATWEGALGNPLIDGYILSSSAAGVRSWIAPSSGGGAVTSVFTRTGAVVAAANDYTFAQIGSKPTTLAGYGITDPVVLTSGSYANPAWITSLIWSKITTTPTTLAGYGITDPVVLTTGSYSNPAWITSLVWSKITSTPTTLAGYGISNGVSNAGTPSSGQLAQWTGATTIQGISTLPASAFPALTGDVVTTAGSTITTVTNGSITYGKMQNTSAASVLLGRGSSGVGSPQEITLGTNLSITGTTLNAAGGGGGAPGGSALTVQVNNGSGGFSGIDNATQSGSAGNYTLVTTGESVQSPLVTGDPVGVQFTKVVTGLPLTTTGETLIYTPPAGRSCLAQGFFRVTKTRGSVPTTFPVVRIDNGSGGILVPAFTENSTNSPVGVVWVTATTASAFTFATSATGVYVNVTTASNATGGHTADIIVELTLY